MGNNMANIIARNILEKKLSEEQKGMDKSTQDKLKVPYDKQGNMDQNKIEEYVKNLQNDDLKKLRLEQQAMKSIKMNHNSSKVSVSSVKVFK